MSVSIGRMMGIPVTIHYTLWFIFILIAWSLAYGYMPREYPGLGTLTYWGIGVASAIILFASVLVHELSHSFVAKRHGLPIRRITLFFFGGVSEMSEEPRDPGLEISIAAAGPVMSFMIAAVLEALLYVSSALGAGVPVIATFRYGALINVVVGAFNLLPAFPLDGGRVLRGVLWRRFRNIISATKTATKVTEALSLIMMMGGFVGLFYGYVINGIWMIVLGWLIKSGAETSLRQTLIGEVLSGILVKDLMSRNVLTVPPDITVQQLVVDYFLTHHYGGFPVVREGQLMGLVTLQSIRQIPKEQRETVAVRQAMIPSERMVTVSEEATAMDAFQRMVRERVGRVLVVEGTTLQGIITRGDIMRAIKAREELQT